MGLELGLGSGDEHHADEAHEKPTEPNNASAPWRNLQRNLQPRLSLLSEARTDARAKEWHRAQQSRGHDAGSRKTRL
jgi:hypothetical protein